MHLRKRAGIIINYLAIATILIGTLGITGWMDIAHTCFIYILSNSTAMKFITALSTVLTGTALLSINNANTIIAQLFSSIAWLISIATLAEYLFNTDLKVDIVFPFSF